MSSASPPPLVLEPRRSRWLAAFIAGSHLLAAAPVSLLPLPWWLGLGWLLTVGVSLLWEWRRHVAPAARLPLRVHYGAAGWELEYAQERRPTRLRGWYAHPRLCILRFERSVPPLILPADALSREEHRRLRVLLRNRDPR